MSSRVGGVAAGVLISCVTFSGLRVWAQQSDAGAARAGDGGRGDAGSSARGDAGVDAEASVGVGDCPDELAPVDRAGHCCATGQRWGAGRCEGAPTGCAPGRVLGREDGGVACVPRACEAPLTRAADGVHCCHPGQVFRSRERRCIGARECPPGTERGGLGGEECVPRVEAGSARPAGTAAGMQWVPGGTFEMGARGGGRIVRVGPFWIDRTEVTASAYAGCVRAGRCDPLSDPYGVMRGAGAPAVNVTHPQARAFCAWRDARLPSEAEWELAARGVDGRMYPWGDRAPDCVLSRGQGCGPGASAAGSHPAGASPYGVMDLAGNVAEWVADRAGSLAPGFERDPEGPSEGATRIVRGGSFLDGASGQRAIARGAYAPTEARGELGFRCARGG
jgi:formylglycine-generating enzyme required for sulfatase activity